MNAVVFSKGVSGCEPAIAVCARKSVHQSLIEND